MLRFVGRRLLAAAAVLLAVSAAAFALYYAVPNDPGYFLTGTQNIDPAELAKARETLGVDRPVWRQYVAFLGRLSQGDLGISWSLSSDPVTGRFVRVPVSGVVLDAARVTVSLAIGGAVVLMLLAAPLGALAASRRGTWVDRVLLAVAVAAVSTHPIVVGLVLRLFAADRLGLAPPGGYCSLAPKPRNPDLAGLDPARRELLGDCSGPVAWASHLALPWLTFGLVFLALYLRTVRAGMLEQLGEGYVRTARAKGAPETRVLRQAFRNAMAPVVTMVGMDFALALGAAIYVETAFGLPGLGRLALVAFSGEPSYDLPVIVAVILVVATTIVVVNLVVDLVVVATDPRLRDASPGSVRH